ncbi:NAD-dependent epimerase/dehydratase family protein [candidate division KSB1 bacterium]|nr:NAD-dependent epimerase/dehydratase family protein [candidate division KSB1 bacterium]
MSFLSSGAILITGGAGFVGSNLAIGLKKRFPGLSIIALDNLKRRGSEFNVPRLLDFSIQFIHGDVRNQEDLINLPKAPSLIIECSAEPSVMAGYAGSHAYMINSNLSGSINCFELARHHHAAIIFLSTSRVYPHEQINKLIFDETANRFELDDQSRLPGISHRGVAENFPIHGRRTLYGATKYASELLLTEYSDMFNIPYVINRCGVIAGPWQMGKIDQGVFALWMAAHVFKHSLRYVGYGGMGKQVRDVLHIDDLLELIIYQTTNMASVQSKTYNVGGGTANAISLRELTQLCREISGNEIHIESDLSNRPGDVKWYITDNSYVMKDTSWNVKANTERIMTNIWEWIRRHETELKPYLRC